MRILKTKAFHRWAKKINLHDEHLRQAIAQIEQGLFDANLGGYLYKKRIAIGSKGKSGGLRTIIAFKKEDKAFFIYGFAKNSKGNINEEELTALKDLAKVYFSSGDKLIEDAIKNNKIIEVINNE